LLFEGSAEGLDPSLDIDAGQELGGGVFLMSFDTTGAIAGLVFDDGDVVRFDGTNWTLEVDGSAVDSDWAAADLDVVMVPEPSFGPLLLVKLQIESLLQASPKKAHLELEKLLRGSRITVYQSPGSRDYNIEGTAELTLEAHTAGRLETTGRMFFSSRAW